MDYKYKVAMKREWLEGQPALIPAWKVVKIRRVHGKTRLVPPHMWYQGYLAAYKRINKVRKTTKKKAYCNYLYSNTCTSYQAYFHLFITKSAARKWAKDMLSVKVIKCVVPKKSVTDVGLQRGIEVIVAKRYDIVGEDEYFD